MSPKACTSIRLRRGKRRHATSHIDPAKTACGRCADGAVIAEHDPNCLACLAVIKRVTAEAEAAE